MKPESEMSTATKSIQDDQREVQSTNRVADTPQVQWSIAASSGTRLFNCWKTSSTSGALTTICRVQIEGQHWQRGLAIADAQQVADFDVVLPQVEVSIVALQDLRQRLVEWHTNPSSFRCDLSGRTKGQSLIFSIGQVTDLIYTPHKPACTIEYHAGASMQATWSFVVDQSCIRLCCVSISGFLAKV